MTNGWEPMTNPTHPDMRFTVLDKDGKSCGERRTRADAVALARRLATTDSGMGPYRITWLGYTVIAGWGRSTLEVVGDP